MLKILIKKFFFIFLFLPFLVYSYPSNSIYNLNMSLVDINGKQLNLTNLSGKVQVFSMIYTNCKTVCPIIIANMKAIEKLVLSNNIKNINFSLFSLDPDRDNVFSLKKYFLEKKMTNETWSIYKSSKEETLRLALTLGIKYKKEKNNEYTHSNLIIIIDKDGVIRLHHQGLDKNFNSVIKLLSQLSD